MAKQVNEEHKAPAAQRKRPEAAASRSISVMASMTSAHALQTLQAGIPPGQLSPEDALELAAQIGNSAFLELLRAGPEVLTVTPPQNRTPQENAPVNPVTVRPCEVCDPGEIFCRGQAPEAFSLTGAAGGMQAQGAPASGGAAFAGGSYA